MIQKLEQSAIGTNYGCGGASFSEVIDKVNEVIDYINSRPEEIPPCQTGFKGHSDPVGRRGRQGMVPRRISEKAEEYQRQMEPPYDSDDIISAYESGAMWNDQRFVYGPKGDPDPAGTSDLEEAAKEYASKTLCDPDDGPSTGLAKDAFIAGAEWQEKQDLRWAGEIHKNGYDLCKEQMLKDAIEGVVYRYKSHKRIATAIVVDIPRETLGNRVKLIIVK